MQEKYSPIITQSLFEIHTFFFWTQKFSFFDTPSVGFCRGNSMRRSFCSEQLALQDSVQTFNAYPYSKHLIYLFIYYIYIYRTGLSASYGSTVTHTHTHFAPQTEYWTRDNCTACNFSLFFVLFLKNARHLPRSYLYSVTGRVKYHVIYKLI